MSHSSTQIKLCGMTRQQDVETACQLNVDALGFIFFPKSKRAIDLSTAINITKNVPNTIQRFAVLVNPDSDFVGQVIEQFKPTLLQFHGDESPAFCQQFDYPYIKALSLNNTLCLKQLCNQYADAQALLFDTPAEKRYGGTGMTFDWSLIPKNMTKPFILAGGLNASNVMDAIDQVHPMMVDCCSGVEHSPGHKDSLLMKQFIQKVREE